MHHGVIVAVVSGLLVDGGKKTKAKSAKSGTKEVRQPSSVIELVKTNDAERRGRKNR